MGSSLNSFYDLNHPVCDIILIQRKRENLITFKDWANGSIKVLLCLRVFYLHSIPYIPAKTFRSLFLTSESLSLHLCFFKVLLHESPWFYFQTSMKGKSIIPPSTCFYLSLLILVITSLLVWSRPLYWKCCL